MKSYIEIVDTDDDFNLIDEYEAPFDMEVNCYKICVYGEDFNGMMLRGKCNWLVFDNTYNYNKVDLNGFMELEIEEISLYGNEKGLLKILELNCKKILCFDKKLEKIMNKYVQEEPDPLMRDIQGCKYELAINGYGELL